MGKVLGICACLVIVTLDVTAGILGIKAEAAQNQERHLRLWIFECKQPSQDAFVLGLAASALVVIAHVIANLVGGCNICSEEYSISSPSKQLAIACLLFTWVILVAALGALAIGTISNNKSRASCGLTHHHFLAIGGIACMVHALFSVAYCEQHSLNSSKHVTTFKQSPCFVMLFFHTSFLTFCGSLHFCF